MNRLLLALLLLCPELLWAGQVYNFQTGKKDLCSTIQESDGSPAATGCNLISVGNGSLTDNGDGTYTLATSPSTYVESVADGTGIDGTATGSASVYTPTLDTTEVNDTTWGDNSDTLQTWTHNASGAGTADAFLTFDNAGNVGVGRGTATDPVASLHLYDTNALGTPAIRISGVSGQRAAFLGDDQSTSNSEAGNLTLYIDDTARITLSANNSTGLFTNVNGTFGIGLNTPASSTQALTIDYGNRTSVTTESNMLLLNAQQFDLTSGTTLANQRQSYFTAATINGVAGGATETVTDSSTVYIDAAPSGSNVTFTNGPYALFVDAGITRLDGNVSIGGTTTPTAALDVTGTVVTNSTITSSATGSLGWVVVDQTDNQACNTGCTSACVMGIDNATGSAVTNLVSCDATTADLCLCAGSS